MKVLVIGDGSRDRLVRRLTHEGHELVLAGSDPGAAADSARGPVDPRVREIEAELVATIDAAVGAAGPVGGSEWRAARARFRRLTLRSFARSAAFVEALVVDERPDRVVVCERATLARARDGGRLLAAARFAVRTRPVTVRSTIPGWRRALLSGGARLARLAGAATQLARAAMLVVTARRAPHDAVSRGGAGVLVLVHSPTSWRVAEPVLAALRRHPDLAVCAVRYGRSSRGVALPSVEHLMTRREARVVLSETLALRRVGGRVERRLRRAAAVDSFVASRVRDFFGRVAPAHAALRGALGDVLRRASALAVLALNADEMSNTIVLAAREAGARCAYLPHGRLDEGFFDGVEFDAYLVHGPGQGPTVTGAVPHARVDVVGFPPYDALVAAGALPDRAGTEWTVLVATEGRPAVPDWQVDLLGALRGLALVRVIVKVHPLESRANRARLALLCDGNVELVEDADMAELIARSDVFVAEGSTTVLEALVLGTPTVVVGPGSMAFSELADAGLLHRAVVAQEALEVIDELLHAPADKPRRVGYHELLEEQVGPLDGQSAERVAARLRELMLTVRPPGSV